MPQRTTLLTTTQSQTALQRARACQQNLLSPSPSQSRSQTLSFPTHTQQSQEHHTQQRQAHTWDRYSLQLDTVALLILTPSLPGFVHTQCQGNSEQFRYSPLPHPRPPPPFSPPPWAGTTSLTMWGRKTLQIHLCPEHKSNEHVTRRGKAPSYSLRHWHNLQSSPPPTPLTQSPISQWTAFQQSTPCFFVCCITKKLAALSSVQKTSNQATWSLALPGHQPNEMRELS